MSRGGSAIQQYDDVKIGYDNNGDGDILDAGDDVQVSDNFNSNVMSLTYDNNGNLTDDAVLRYVYDGWNRLKKAQRYADGDTTTIATYSYLADGRRASKVVEHCGIEAVANDGGDTTVHFYYGGVPGAAGGVTRWNIFETRNGSNQSTRQWVWGTQYVDEVLLMDVNGDPANSNICDVDDPNHPTGTRRYFYHQDRNWNVIALTEYDDGAGTNGRLAERYAYTPYGEFVVLKGDGGSGELGRTLVASTVGNPFFHQGLPFDHEKGQYQNWHRMHAGTMRDPAAWAETVIWSYYDGYTQCGLTLPPGTPMTIWNGNNGCTRPCTQAHEEKHVADLTNCCEKARAAYQAPNANKEWVTAVWNAYLYANRSYLECRAFGMSCACGGGMVSSACCSQWPNPTCCLDALSYNAWACSMANSFCTAPGHEWMTGCPFP